MKNKILILDDNSSVLTALEMLLLTEFENIYTLKNPNSLISTIQEKKIDVVLLDMNFTAGINNGNEGIYWLGEIQKFDPTISVIMITAYGDIELAVKAVKKGAFDFILKPWDNSKLISTLHASLKLRKSKLETTSLKRTTNNLKQELKQPNFHKLIWKSGVMQNVMNMIKKVAATDANVLITGENGTGKELIAAELHKYSKRNNEVMVSVDMGSVSESLFESELFGHTKGSFTDAKEDRAGRFETAQKGTLFLDEIGNLTMSLQAKILAALQNRTITRVGSNTPIPIDIRLISATNKNLATLIADGLFREDLLFRINTISIELPPLRERGTDILLLAGRGYPTSSIKWAKPNRLIVCGSAIEEGLPDIDNIISKKGEGVRNCYISVFNSETMTLEYTSLFGGNEADIIMSAHFLNKDTIVIGGMTNSADFRLPRTLCIQIIQSMRRPSIPLFLVVGNLLFL